MSEDILRTDPHLFLGSRLKRLGERLQSDAIRVAREAGLDVMPGQYPLLASLDRFGPRTIGQLAIAMEASQPTITRTVLRLERAGLVEVRRGDEDRRHKIVALSAAGAAVVARSKAVVWPRVEAAVREACAGLSETLLEQLDGMERMLGERPLSERARTAVVLEPARHEDVPEVAGLMNLAFRGAGHGASWNSEADYMDGDRTSEAEVRAAIADPAGAFLVWRGPDGDVQGCVRLEPAADGTWWLGSLAVAPARQDGGLGRRLLAAAEAWIVAKGGRQVRMTVVNVRDTLIAWYERRGYVLTGERRPYPYEDGRYGRPRRDDLEFVVLAKAVGPGRLAVSKGT